MLQRTHKLLMRNASSYRHHQRMMITMTTRPFTSYWENLKEQHSFSNENGILGQHKFEQRMYEEALEHFKQCKIASEHDTVLHAWMALCYSHLDEMEQSIHCFEQYLQHHPGDAYHISNLAQQYHLQDSTDKADALYQSALSCNPSNGDLNFYYAHFLMHCVRDYAKALTYATQTIECDNVSPPLASPYILMAQLHAMLQDSKAAQKYFDIAVHEIGDDNCNAYFNYAQIMDILGQRKQCMQLVQTALQCLDESNPHHPTKNECLELLIACCVRLSDYQHAVAYAKQLQDLDIYDNLRVLYDKLNATQLTTAETRQHFYEHDIQANENEYYSNLFYAKYLMQKQEYAEALTFVQKAHAIDGTHYTSYYYRALVLYLMWTSDAHNNSGADAVHEIIDLFNCVIEKQPGEINCYAFLGVIYQKLGDNEKAMRCIKEGLAMDSGTNLLHFQKTLLLLAMERMDEYTQAMQHTMKLCEVRNKNKNNRSDRKTTQFNPQLFYIKNNAYNVNNAIHSTAHVLTSFGDFYLNHQTQSPNYQHALQCYLDAMDQIELTRNQALEEHVLSSIATCYLNLENEQENMKRYCSMGIHKYPNSADLNFLYSQYLFQFARSYVLALKYLDRSMEFQPENMTLMLLKANLLHNYLWDNPAAITCLNKVLYCTDKNDPVHAQARECLFLYTKPTHVKL